MGDLIIHRRAPGVHRHLVIPVIKVFSLLLLLLLLLLNGSASALGAPRKMHAPIGGISNTGLSLQIDLSEDLSTATIEATFRFDLEAEYGGPVYFFFPSAKVAGDLSSVRLNGADVSSSLYTMLHPVYGDTVFALPRSAFGAAGGAQQLSVRGPAPAGADGSFVHWGSWHPFLMDRKEPVPIRAEIRVPDEYDVVCSGRLVDQHVTRGVKISTWDTVRPLGWLFVAVGHFQHAAIEPGGVPIDVYWLADDPAFDPRQVGEAPAHILGFYTDQFGPSVIDRYQLIELPVDHIVNFSVNGLIAVSQGSYRRVQDDPQYLATVLAHEIAHYWWGDTVQGQGPGGRWLTEAFAEYSRYLYEAAHDANPLSWGFRNSIVVGQFASEDPPPIWSSTDETGEDETIYYQKGPYVLHMLANMVGEDALGMIFRTFVERFRGRPATIDDFIAVVNEATGTDYRWFFDQWLGRSTGPILHLSDVSVSGEAGSYAVTGTIAQEAPYYRLRVPLRVTTDAADTVTASIDADQARTAFRIRTATKPARLVLDPAHDVFKWYDRADLQIDFAEVYAILAKNPHVAVVGEDGFFTTAVPFSEFEDWLINRFPDVAMDDGAPNRILFGERAAAYRRQHGLAALASDDASRLRVFVDRDAAQPEAFVLGIEGTPSGAWDPILPQGPYRYLELQDSRYVKVVPTSLPAIEVDLADAP